MKSFWLIVATSLILTMGISTSISKNGDSVILKVDSFDKNEKLETLLRDLIEAQLRGSGIQQVKEHGDWQLSVRIREDNSRYIVSPCYSISPEKFRINATTDVYIYGVHTIITDEENNLNHISLMIVGGLEASMETFNK